MEGSQSTESCRWMQRDGPMDVRERVMKGNPFRIPGRPWVERQCCVRRGIGEVCATRLWRGMSKWGIPARQNDYERDIWSFNN